MRELPPRANYPSSNKKDKKVRKTSTEKTREEASFAYIGCLGPDLCRDHYYPTTYPARIDFRKMELYGNNVQKNLKGQMKSK